MVDKPTLLGFWAVIAEKDYSDHVNSKGRVTRIRDPLYRYVSYYCMFIIFDVVRYERRSVKRV
ncbi:hypothetical protein Hanom_Chr04g00380631 [Helianthus anomalus]